MKQQDTSIYTKYRQKKGNLPRLPIFINLKSNTMKNTMQIYRFYVMQHIFYTKKSMAINSIYIFTVLYLLY